MNDKNMLFFFCLRMLQTGYNLFSSPIATQRNRESAAWECVVRPFAEIAFSIGVLALSGVVCGVVSCPLFGALLCSLESNQ